MRAAFARSPRKSIRRASTELQIPRSTIHKIVHRRLHLCAFKIQLRHHIKPNDRRLRAHFAIEMLLRIENDNSCLDNIVFSDEATFLLCAKINNHKCRIWGSGNLHVIHEHERDTPKVNVWCGLTRNSVIEPFFFIEATVTGHVYLDMLQNSVIDQRPPGSIFQQDGAPPHYYRQVREFLNANFSDMWIGRGAGPLAWPSRSPDVIPLDFFLGFCEECVYQGNRPTILEELRGRITNAAALVTPQMLQNTWREVEYRLDVCRATQGAHIELHWPSSETRWVFMSSYVKVYVNNPLFTLEIITNFSILLAWTPFKMWSYDMWSLCFKAGSHLCVALRRVTLRTFFYNVF